MQGRDKGVAAKLAQLDALAKLVETHNRAHLAEFKKLKGKGKDKDKDKDHDQA
jgi:hypothetical protein